MKALYDIFVFVDEHKSVFLTGILNTACIFVLSLVVGGALGLLVALCRDSSVGIIRSFFYAYVFVFRGTPLVVLLYLIYYGLPQLDIIRTSSLWLLFKDPYFCAVLALSLNSSGFVAEIISGAIRNVPQGEIDAARVAGHSSYQVFSWVIVPHTARLALEAYSNEVIFLLKGTSVASLVAIVDLMGVVNAIYFSTYNIITPLLVVAVIYGLLVMGVTRFVRWFRLKLSPELGSGQKRQPSQKSGNRDLLLRA